jgi:NAD(P)-dependent dehydrogenase (short-subunit alcohol dehydrogenase family)
MKGKVALVTGAGSGIGQAAAMGFAAKGAGVVIADLDGAQGSASARGIESAGGQALFVETDVASATAVTRLVEQALGRFGRLDYAVNNAGIQGELKSTAECSEANWDRIIGVNLKGAFLCMKEEIAQMLRQDGGAIVNVASNFGLVGSVGMPAYSASKHGLLGLTKTAALEYATQNIRVNAVCPGPVQTPMIGKIMAAQPELGDQIVANITARLPVRRMGQPEEIGRAIVWLCSDDASFVTGAILAVDGGFVAQ